MNCTQCGRPAMYNVNGHPLCVDHMAMTAQIQGAQNDTTRLLRAMIADDENAIDASFGLAPRRQIQIPPRQVIQAQHTTVNDNSVHIDRSMVGVVNTGTIDNLNASVSQIQEMNSEVAEQIKNLVEAVSRSEELTEEIKKEVIEQVSYLANQVTQPSVNRNSSVLKATMSAIGTTLATSADLLTLWQTLHPVLIGLL